MTNAANNRQPKEVKMTRPTKTILAAACVFTGLAALPSHAADKVTLRLDWVLGGYHAVWHYAKDQGVFSRNGIDIELREGRGSMTTSQTVGNKSDEFGTADGGAMMVLRSKGSRPKWSRVTSAPGRAR